MGSDSLALTLALPDRPPLLPAVFLAAAAAGRFWQAPLAGRWESMLLVLTFVLVRDRESERDRERQRELETETVSSLSVHHLRAGE